MTDGPVPYREVSEPEYTQLAAKSFVIEDFGSGMSLLSGPCPRCRSAIEVPVIDRVVRAVQFDEDLAPTDIRTVPIICTCSEAHPGRPAERVGCGAYWVFDIVSRS
jgi:hypothetical protein